MISSMANLKSAAAAMRSALASAHANWTDPPHAAAAASPARATETTRRSAMDAPCDSACPPAWAWFVRAEPSCFDFAQSEVDTAVPLVDLRLSKIEAARL